MKKLSESDLLKALQASRNSAGDVFVTTFQDKLYTLNFTIEQHNEYMQVLKENNQELVKVLKEIKEGISDLKGTIAQHA